MHNRRGAPRTATHVDSDHVQRFWRTIELAQIGANADMGETRRESLTVGFPDCDRDDRRKNAGEEGMQRAAAVGVVCALIAMMVRALSPVVMRMHAIGVGSGGSCEGFLAREGRRYDTGELGHHEQSDQYPD